MKNILLMMAVIFGLQVAAEAKVEGTRRFTEVIDSVLYFGGVARSDSTRNPLTSSALSNLCNKGFGESIYLYDHNAVDTNVSCGAGNLRYHFIDWRKPEYIMKRIFQNYSGDKGAVYVHCWNGVHASNAIAAVALKQFCGWSDDQAIDWWDAHSAGSDGDVRKWSVRRIQKYKVDSSMQLSAEDQKILCP